MKHFLLVCLLAFAGLACPAAEDDGFVPLFNGRDLSGWVNVNCAPETWSVVDGMIHCTGLPTGALRTPRQYENFILELEWRHLVSDGNSGVFIWASPIAAPGVPFLRAVEIQVLDHGYNVPGKGEWYTTHGDVFPIHGDSMKPFGRHNGMRSFPSEEHSLGYPQWNHYRVVCTNGVIRLHVNGHEVSGGEDCNYCKGYLGLESEGAPVDFRNIRIKELPSTDAPARLTAPLDLGWRPLFTGLDLRGWRTNDATGLRWRASGERMVLHGGGSGPETTLWTDEKFGDAEFIVDCKPVKPAAGGEDVVPALLLGGKDGVGFEIRLEGATAGKYQRFIVTVKGRDVTVMREGHEARHFNLTAGAPQRGSLGLRDTGTSVEFTNLYARDL